MEVKVQKLRKTDFDYGKKEEGDGESGEDEWEGGCLEQRDEESSWDGKPSLLKVAIISCNLVIMSALALNTCMYNELDYS